MMLIRPAMYYATTQVRSDAWATRGAPAKSGSPLEPVPSMKPVRTAV